MKKYLKVNMFMLFLAIPSIIIGKPYVMGKLTGQLGNQMFVIAATVSLALEHNAEPIFPDFTYPTKPDYENMGLNYKMLFHRLNTSTPQKKPSYVYQEPFFHYSPIIYKKNMVVQGYFQSEKYFKKHREYILDLFSPSQEILEYLTNKYQEVIDHPHTVSLHVRSYLGYDPTQKFHPTLPTEYFEKAMELFSDDTLFVVFSNDIEMCKRDFQHMNKNIRFIENEIHIHDFYLMSMCKDNVISNSTFSWWASYINRNLDKLIIAPPIWFGPNLSNLNTKDLFPDDWMVLHY